MLNCYNNIALSVLATVYRVLSRSKFEVQKTMMPKHTFQVTFFLQPALGIIVFSSLILTTDVF